MMQNTVGIDDLPDEVLTQIFDRSDISTATFLNLALSSRRLHYFCLPLYLARFEIFDPQERCEFVLRSPQETPESLDALTGLKIALFIPSVKNIVCRLRLPGDVEDFLYATMHLQRLYDFVSTLSAIDTVTLQFGNKRCGCCSELDPGETLDGNLLEWSNAIGLILNTLLEKSCGSLVIVGGRYMAHSYSLTAARKIRNQEGLLTAFKRLLRKTKFSRLGLSNSYDWINVLQGDTWEYKRAAKTGKAIVLTPLSSAAKSATSLKSLTIQSMMFTVPPILHWTISVLRLPTTEDLCLKNISLPRKSWPVFLSLVAEHCPHLIGLKFSRLLHLNAIDMLHFVGRLPNLESLHIARSVESYDNPNLGSFPKFAHVKTLHAPASWIFKLLSYPRTTLPSLESVCIAYNLRNDNLSDWFQTPCPLKSIPTMLKELFRPMFSISFKIRLGRNPGWAMLEDFNRHDVNDPPDQLKYVVGLTLLVDHKIKANEMALSTILPQWIERFYELRHLALKSNTETMSEDNTAALAKYILKKSRLSHLKTFDVNGEDVMPTSR